MAYDTKVKEYERQNVPRPGNPATNEAWALIEAARRIAGVVRYGDFTKLEDRRKMRDALRLNLRLWTIIQAEQTIAASGEDTSENALPTAIRHNILTLCKFIDNHSVDTMIEPTADKAAVLININRNIAAGLLGSTEDDFDVEVAEEEGTAPSGNEAETPNQAVTVKI